MKEQKTITNSKDGYATNVTNKKNRNDKNVYIVGNISAIPKENGENPQWGRLPIINIDRDVTKWKRRKIFTNMSIDI